MLPSTQISTRYIMGEEKDVSPYVYRSLSEVPHDISDNIPLAKTQLYDTLHFQKGWDYNLSEAAERSAKLGSIIKEEGLVGCWEITVSFTPITVSHHPSVPTTSSVNLSPEHIRISLYVLYSCRFSLLERSCPLMLPVSDNHLFHESFPECSPVPHLFSLPFK